MRYESSINLFYVARISQQQLGQLMMWRRKCTARSSSTVAAPTQSQALDDSMNEYNGVDFFHSKTFKNLNVTAVTIYFDFVVALGACRFPPVLRPVRLDLPLTVHLSGLAHGAVKHRFPRLVAVTAGIVAGTCNKITTRTLAQSIEYFIFDYRVHIVNRLHTCWMFVAQFSLLLCNVLIDKHNTYDSEHSFPATVQFCDLNCAEPDVLAPTYITFILSRLRTPTLQVVSIDKDRTTRALQKFMIQKLQGCESSCYLMVLNDKLQFPLLHDVTAKTFLVENGI
jgi:hypothetical protein